MFLGLQTFPAKFVSYQMKIFRLLQVGQVYETQALDCPQNNDNECHELSRDAPIQISQFLAECEPYMQMDFNRDSQLIADETSIYIDPPTTQSVALIGSRRVGAVTTGQKTRVFYSDSQRHEAQSTHYSSTKKATLELGATK